MSKLGLVMVLMLMAGRAIAQHHPAPDEGNGTPKYSAHNYFVLITAEGGQVFYVRVDSEARSSSAGGHLILAPLRDSNYTITVGFPGQKFPEQQFQLSIHKRDFALSLSRRSGIWGLYDVKGQPLPQAPDPLSDEKRQMSGVKKDDAFSQMMSAIVRDTAVMYNTYASNDSSDSGALPLSEARGASDSSGLVTRLPRSADSSRLPSTSPGIGKAADTASRKSFSSAISKPPDSVGNMPAGVAASSGGPALSGAPSSPTGVMKLSEIKSTQSLRLVYADHSGARYTDTIDVVIPIDSPAAGTHPRRQADSPSPTRESGMLYVNSDCHAFATDYDVDRLRSKMLGAPRDGDRLQLARKILKIKCFSTSQIRSLSEVYASEAGKFKFLELAYPFVSDAQFPKLIDLFHDPIYVGKFRSMTDRH